MIVSLGEFFKQSTSYEPSGSTDSNGEKGLLADESGVIMVVKAFWKSAKMFVVALTLVELWEAWRRRVEDRNAVHNLEEGAVV